MHRLVHMASFDRVVVDILDLLAHHVEILNLLRMASFLPGLVLAAKQSFAEGRAQAELGHEGQRSSGTRKSRNPPEQAVQTPTGWSWPISEGPFAEATGRVSGMKKMNRAAATVAIPAKT